MKTPSGPFGKSSLSLNPTLPAVVNPCSHCLEFVCAPETVPPLRGDVYIPTLRHCPAGDERLILPTRLCARSRTRRCCSRTCETFYTSQFRDSPEWRFLLPDGSFRFQGLFNMSECRRIFKRISGSKGVLPVPGAGCPISPHCKLRRTRRDVGRGAQTFAVRLGNKVFVIISQMDPDSTKHSGNLRPLGMKRSRARSEHM